MDNSIALLLVEDSLPEQELIRDVFSSSPFDDCHVGTAVRLAEALAYLKDHAIDLIVLDLNLPDSDGLASLAAIREQAPDLPVIVLTGNDDVALGKEAMRLGAQDFLAKGSGAEVLLPRICFYALERYRAQQKTQTAEMFLRKSLDAMSAQIAIVNRKKEIVLVNRAWHDFASGFDSDPAESDEIGTFFKHCLLVKNSHENEIERIGETIERIFSGELASHEFEYSCEKEAKKRWLQVKITPFTDRRSEFVVVACDDITGRVEMEIMLRQSRNFLRTILDTSPNLIFVKDLRGRYVMVNQTLIDLYESSFEEMLGKTDFEILAAKNLDTAEALFFQHGDRLVLESEKMQVFDAQSLTAANGRKAWYRTVKVQMVQPDSEPLLLGIATDITEDLKNQTKRRRSEQLMRTLLNALHLRIILLDSSMQVIWANDRALRESSCDHNEEIIGREYREVWRDSGVCLDCPVSKALKTGKIEVQTQTSPENQVLRITGCPVMDENGHICQVISITEDISERLSLERQLRQAQKMESLGTLAGGIAHDFNNILTAILGFTELGRHKISADSDLADDLEEIHKAGMRARDLVHQILTFCRQVEQEIAPLDLSRVIREALKLLRASLPSSIRFFYDIPANLGLVQADPTQIHQVVMNLCTNAAHAMAGSGGELSATLTEKYLSQEDLVLYHDLVAGLYLEFTVSDTGRGIPPENLQVIFDPYFTTKEVGEGTGLGLAVVHGIVRDYGGYIEVASVVGEGTTFTILLPAYIGAEKEPTEEDHTVEAVGRGESILVVDDEPALLKVFQRLFKKHGYKVDTCKDPRQAQKKIQNNPIAYDLMLSDVVMPYISGDNLAVEARRIAQDLPVILMSGNINKITLSRELGDDVLLLKKPLDSNILLTAVRELLDGLDSQ